MKRSVWSPDKTPRRELKIRRPAEYFWRTSRCFIWWWNTVSNAWYYFSNKMALEGEIKDSKKSSFSSDFQTLIKHLLKFPCIFFLNYQWVWKVNDNTSIRTKLLRCRSAAPTTLQFSLRKCVADNHFINLFFFYVPGTWVWEEIQLYMRTHLVWRSWRDELRKQRKKKKPFLVKSTSWRKTSLSNRLVNPLSTKNDQHQFSPDDVNLR